MNDSLSHVLHTADFLVFESAFVSSISLSNQTEVQLKFKMSGRFLFPCSLLVCRRFVSQTGQGLIYLSNRYSQTTNGLNSTNSECNGNADDTIVSKRRFTGRTRYGKRSKRRSQLGVVMYAEDIDSFDYGNSTYGIVSYLDQFVIGQQEAKGILAISFYEHSKRIQNNLITYPVNSPSFLNTGSGTFSRRSKSSAIACLMDEKIQLDKSNILLLGPSGVGKTYMTEIVAKLLDVPFASANATTLTRAGYVGEDVESVIQKLLENANGDVKRAERGVVFIDEIDKIASSNRSQDNQRDVAGRDVQQSMLKMVEGTKVEVKKGAKGQNVTVQVNTKEILFVVSGAFTSLEEIVGRRLDNRSLGFGASTLSFSITKDDKEKELIQMKKDKLLSRATHDDLVEYGMIQEFAGRFPVIAPFHTLTKDMLKEILIKPKGSLVAQQKTLFALDDVISVLH
uniref:AAA+ ATPase domain-containing protein n=1 Tax=Ditylenchus dipsaci TaxID=166011 RepID=A0A915DUS6_9BILA